MKTKPVIKFSDFDRKPIVYFCIGVGLWILAIILSLFVSVYQNPNPNYVMPLLLLIGFVPFFYYYVFIYTPIVNFKGFQNYIIISYAILKKYKVVIAQDKIKYIYSLQKSAAKIWGDRGFFKDVPGRVEWIAFIGSANGKALVIETQDKIYLISCLNAEEIADRLRELLHISSKAVDSINIQF